ncbi:MAG TPA: diguanylate cyclase [Beijerinckiaceae bacterium]
MEDHLVLAVGILRRLGLAALVVMAHSELLRRLEGRLRAQQAATGLLFGAAAVFSMASPTPSALGVVIDGRSVLVGLAGPFGGWPGTLAAALVVGAYRVWLGGAGAPSGLVGIAIAAGAGLAFARRSGRPPERLRICALALLGAMSSLSVLSTLALPAEIRWTVFAATAGPVAAATMAGVVVLGTLLVRERRRVLAEAALREAAMIDSLTGLPNRRAFHDHLGRAVAQAGRSAPLALLMLDLDGFKALNDAHGHEAGDAALVALGRALQGILREADVPARLGGDEFGVVLPATTAEGARHLAERIRAAVEEASLSVSVGAAAFVPGMTPQQLLKAADEALYRAKREGRNRVSMTAAYALAA